MRLPENAFCPVCNRVFEENDDVVFCPECGTPHHRDCYKAVGHCVNRGLHASGYSYYSENKPIQEKKEEAESEDEISSIFDSFKSDDKIAADSFAFPNLLSMDSVYEKDEQKIDGESVADYASAIRTNAPRFINIFKEFEYKGRKISWNWSAFFFGSLYLFYRKMYKHAIAFMAAFVGVIYASCFAITKVAPLYVEAVKKFADLYAQNKLTNEDMMKLANVSDMSKANLVLYITLGVILILRVIQALYADRFYKSTLSEIIKNVNEQLKEGASFIQSPMFPSQNSELTQKQMKQYYLARRGGTNFFMPLLAASAIYFLTSIAYSTLFF